MTGYFSSSPRPLLPGDSEAVRALVLGALGITPYVDRVIELLTEAARGDTDTQALVIERDGTVAALALFGEVAGTVRTWRLHTVLLSPRVEMRDVGHAIVEGLVDRVRALGARMLVAELPADAAYGRSLSLLRACNFDQEGRIPDYFRDEVALLFLRRDL